MGLVSSIRPSMCIKNGPHTKIKGQHGVLSQFSNGGKCSKIVITVGV